MLEVRPRFAEFSKEEVPLGEVLEFYALPPEREDESVPSDRPYTWSMAVSSVDGVTTFGENPNSTKEIAMCHVPASGSGADWRLLCAGWMFADAVLGSGEILRQEPKDLLWIPTQPEFLEYRANHLHKQHSFPIQVILTASGDIPIADKDRPMFQRSDLKTLILTTPTGKHRIERSLSESSSGLSLAILEEQHNTHVHVLSSSSSSSSSSSPSSSSYSLTSSSSSSPSASSSLLDLKEVVKYLREEGVKYLDVTAGSKVFSSMIHQKLVDECRVTITGQLVGPLSSCGEPRPQLFGGRHVYTAENNPVLSYDGIRFFGKHHLFVRSSVTYRH
ncbi:hypothetical protein QOT17_011328 [Balamuthia mandrillaris]